MIIECPNCNKKFEVNSDLIPSSGRSIQCGSCNHTWFFKKKAPSQKSLNDLKTKKIPLPAKEKIIDQNKNVEIYSDNTSNDFKDKNVKVENKRKINKKKNLNFRKFLFYIIVLIITFVALIIFLDTFKSPLYNIFPNIETILFNLFETLKDIQLFIKDLI